MRASWRKFPGITKATYANTFTNVSAYPGNGVVYSAAPWNHGICYLDACVNAREAVEEEVNSSVDFAREFALSMIISRLSSKHPTDIMRGLQQ